MAKRTVEGSVAVADVMSYCDLDVVACYPITPSTHVAEHLADLYANGEVKSYITTDSELSSMSACIGASAAGGRTATVTSSQGLALMHEAVFCAAGMRLPIVMIVGNRALSAPLNIWNDQEDSIVERDSGWIQVYLESNQETVDMVPQAFKIAEATMLPIMVCFDGFYLTHAVEPLEIPEKEQVAKFLPKFKPAVKLDPKAPMSMGEYALPAYYQSFREDVQKDMLAAEKKVKQVHDEFTKQFGRSYGDGTIEEYQSNDAEIVLLSFGSICGNIKEAVDALRAKGEKVGLVRVRLFRPFPYAAVAKAIDGKKAVGVFEKAYSLGALPPLYVDTVVASEQAKKRPVISSFIGGLGGKDVTVADMASLFQKIKQGKKLAEWV